MCSCTKGETDTEQLQWKGKDTLLCTSYVTFIRPTVMKQSMGVEKQQPQRGRRYFRHRDYYSSGCSWEVGEGQEGLPRFP